MHFHDRQEAGKKLATALQSYKNQECIIYPLPRGGVVLGVEIAKSLHKPLDLIIPRKIGHPYNPEYAIAAVTEHGKPVCNEGEVSRIDAQWYQQEIVNQREEAARRRLLYLHDRQPVSVTGKTAIIVDDGIATGLTMIAAINDIRQRQPGRIVVAIPVVPKSTAARLEKLVDKIVALDIPEAYLGAVGAYYDNFNQVSDDEVIAMIKDLALSPVT